MTCLRPTLVFALICFFVRCLRRCSRLNLVHYISHRATAFQGCFSEASSSLLSSLCCPAVKVARRPLQCSSSGYSLAGPHSSIESRSLLDIYLGRMSHVFGRTERVDRTNASVNQRRYRAGQSLACHARWSRRKKMN